MFRTIEEVMNATEELHEDLLPYVEKSDMWGMMIRHPLVFSVPHSPQMNALVNERYKHTKAEVEKLRASKRFASYVFRHERAYRLNALLEVMREMKDEEFWEVLGEAWVDSENIWQNLSTWKMLLKSTRKGREHFMNEEERKMFEELPETLVVHRGFIPGKNKKGLSYTLDEKKAEWFAKRFHKEGEVSTLTIPKSKAFAYLTGRGESEIIMI